MEAFGYPPVFPSADQEVVAEVEKDIIPKDKSKSKKSKAVAKTGSAKYQWQIMQSLNLKDEEIKLFADPAHWLEYFPPLAVQDLNQFGIHVIKVLRLITLKCHLVIYLAGRLAPNILDHRC